MEIRAGNELALLLSRETMPKTKLIGSRRRNLTQGQDRTSGKHLVAEDLTQRLRVLQVRIWKSQMGPLRETEYSCAVRLTRRELEDQSAKGSSFKTNNRWFGNVKIGGGNTAWLIVGVKLYYRQSIQFPTHVLVQLLRLVSYFSLKAWFCFSCLSFGSASSFLSYLNEQSNGSRSLESWAKFGQLKKLIFKLIRKLWSWRYWISILFFFS